MIRILVVDDHLIVREGVAKLLALEHDIEVIGQAASGHEAVRLCREHEPDVVVLDYGLPDLDGLETTRQIKELGNATRILILTMYTSEEYALRLLQTGASGYVIKGAPAEELLTAVRKVARGGRYVTPDVADRMLERIGQPTQEVPEASLSDREMQVLIQIASGSSTKEIARFLSLSISTVETYRTRLMDKLNLRSTADLTRFAIRRGLIDAG